MNNVTHFIQDGSKPFAIDLRGHSKVARGAIYQQILDISGLDDRSSRDWYETADVLYYDPQTLGCAVRLSHSTYEFYAAVRLKYPMVEAKVSLKVQLSLPVPPEQVVVNGYTYALVKDSQRNS